MRIDRVALISEMARKDMSAAQLSKKTGLSRSTITSIRSGKSCNANSAKLIAEALRINVSDLLRKEDS